jgi:glycosyltransferase involved in cell wall biosynthesis
VTKIFYAYRDSPERRSALAAAPGAAERYRLYGLDELRERGHDVRHNLERGLSPAWARVSGGLLKSGLARAGGYGGDFATVLGSFRAANRANVVLSTVDTVGIPLLLTERSGLLRPPLVYVAIGLPERLAQLRSERMQQLYADALSRCAAVLAYGAREADDLRGWLDTRGSGLPVSFVPFGVDTDALRPSDVPARHDVVSVGADPHRDFPLLLEVARVLPEASFCIVATRDAARALVNVPTNVAVEVDLSFERMLERLGGGRVVALPVRENTYSGATTVLLQAMALEKPVVVSRTSAIASGYGLVDGENCRLVEPGDAVSFAKSVRHVLDDELHARALAVGARRTAERELTWTRYVDRLEEILLAALRTA